jgi:hypothetical protein
MGHWNRYLVVAIVKDMGVAAPLLAWLRGLVPAYPAMSIFRQAPQRCKLNATPTYNHDQREVRQYHWRN